MASLLYHDQGIAPVKQPEKQRQRHSRRGVDAPWLDAAFLVRRQFAAKKWVFRFDGSPKSYGQRNQADKVGQQPKDDSKENDPAAIMLQLGASRATGSVRPRSNICGAHPDAQQYRCVAGGILPTGSGPKGIRRDRVKAHAPGNMFLILLA